MNQYLFEITTNTSVLSVIAKDYKEALDKIENEINIPKEFIKDYYLEKVTVLLPQHLVEMAKQQEQKNVND
jgi:hypothetical protein